MNPEGRTLPLENPKGIFQWKYGRGHPYNPNQTSCLVKFDKSNLRAKARWQFIIFQLRA